MSRIGRNDPCPCGSGRKFKQCCLARVESSNIIDYEWQKLRRTEGEVVEKCLAFARERYGEGCLYDAWEDFMLEEDVPMEGAPEIETIFTPWFLFNWRPVPVTKDFSIEEYYSGDPIAITCLIEQSYKFDDYQRELIRRVCQEPFTFYVVIDTDPGKSITFRNLILGNEIKVKEIQGSLTAKRGDILFTRILTMNGVSIMVGCAPILIPSRFHLELLDLRDQLKKVHGKIDREMLCILEPIFRERYLDIVDEACNPTLPRLQNTDGDPLLFVKLRYEIRTTPQEAFDQLKVLMLEGMEPDDKTFDKSGNLKSIEFGWGVEGNKKHKDWDNTVMGHFEIDGSVLTVEVNSEKRSKKVQTKIKKLLGKRAVLKKIETETIEEKMEKDRENFSPEERRRKGDEHRKLNESPEVKKYLKEMMEKHWETWLNSKIPALKNKTPREAAKTKKGRERLEALLLDFEGRGDQSNNPMQPDISALRKSLGLDRK